MKTKNIYIIRHGQTDYNLNNMVQGRGIDSSLNETGLHQAALFFKAYRHLNIDKIYTSELIRTTESVKGFLDLSIASEKLGGLDEISWGVQEGKVYDPETHKIYLDTIQAWSEGNLNMAVGGGETPLDVVKRQRESFKYILSKRHEDTVLIATHGRALRMLICWLLNYPLDLMDAFDHQNLCLYHLEYSDSVFRVMRHGDTKHLKE